MKSFNIIMTVFFLGLFFLSSRELQAQNKFKAAAVVGLTAAQLGGDSLSGYNKLGSTFGLHLRYAVNKQFDLNIELLYAQRGSRRQFGFSKSADNTTQLNYLEIPVYLTVNDWLIEKENYYKVGLFGGLCYGFLISANSTNNILMGRESEFKEHDISARAGVYYAFTKNLVFRTYYTDSFIKLVEGDLFNTDGLDSFFWTFRLEYNF